MLDPVAVLEAEREEETAAAEDEAEEPKHAAFTIDTLPDEVVVTLVMGGCRDKAGRIPKVSFSFRPLYSAPLQELFEGIEIAAAGKEGEAAHRIRAVKRLDALMQILRSVEGYGADIDALTGPALRAFFEGRTVPVGTPPSRAAEFAQALEAQVERALDSYRRAQEPISFFR